MRENGTVVVISNTILTIAVAFVLKTVTDSDVKQAELRRISHNSAGTRSLI